jgi:hypothetical protein
MEPMVRRIAAEIPGMDEPPGKNVKVSMALYAISGGRVI